MAVREDIDKVDLYLASLKEPQQMLFSQVTIDKKSKQWV